MGISRLVVAAIGLSLIGSGASADSLSIDFTAKKDTAFATPVQISSAGNLLLTLNQDGTIAALFTPASKDLWFGVGLDSINPYNYYPFFGQGKKTGWQAWFGEFDTGIYIHDGYAGPLAWTIVDVSPFSSVRQLVTGTGSTYDGFFFNGTGEYAGSADVDNAVPETETWTMVTLGIGAVGIAMRRRKIDARIACLS